MRRKIHCSGTRFTGKKFLTSARPWHLRGSRIRALERSVTFVLIVHSRCKRAFLDKSTLKEVVHGFAVYTRLAQAGLFRFSVSGP
jgi:hypothetical protein